MKNRGNILDKVGTDKGVLGAMTINFMQYHTAISGLMKGDYQLDVGGFVFDYTMAQAQDSEIALSSRLFERSARVLGLDSVIGVEATLGLHRNLHGMSRQERMSYVRELSKKYRSRFAERYYWSRRL